MGESPLRVVVAGGGAAGLEALLALHALAGDRVALTLVTPMEEFVYRPLIVRENFAPDRIRRVPLAGAAKEAQATFVSASVEAVDPAKRTLTTTGGDELAYDALVLATGANQVPVVEHAVTWDDHTDAETIGGLMRDIEQEYARSLAVVIPPGASSPLRAYELAIFVTIDARGVLPSFEITLVTPEPSPVDLLGADVAEQMQAELDRVGVTVVSAERVRVVRTRPAALVLEPGRRRLDIDRVLALPAFRGRPIEGIPGDPDGFFAVDERCRVQGLEGVWAVGDCIAFPLKSGGFATEQADVAAEDIAAGAGADVTTHTFEPSLHRELAGSPAGQFLESWLGRGRRRLATHVPGGEVPLLTYLERDLAAGWRGPH